MGFYIQDDYYAAAVDALSKREQEQYWSALIRYYFDPRFKAEDERMTKAVRGMFGAVRGRIDRARAEAERKRSYRGQSQDRHGTVTGQSADNPRTLCAAPIQSEREKEIRERKKKEKEAPSASSPCPKCGEECGAINPGMYRCNFCDVTWKGAAS